MSLKIIEKQGYAFVASWNGTTVKISIPAKTPNEWGSKDMFLDLPYMTPETLEIYIMSLQEIYEHCTIETTNEPRG